MTYLSQPQQLAKRDLYVTVLRLTCCKFLSTINAMKRLVDECLTKAEGRPNYFRGSCTRCGKVSYHWGKWKDVERWYAKHKCED